MKTLHNIKYNFFFRRKRYYKGQGKTEKFNKNPLKKN